MMMGAWLEKVLALVDSAVFDRVLHAAGHQLEIGAQAVALAIALGPPAELVLSELISRKAST